MERPLAEIRVLIVDDHEVVREGISAVLAREAGIRVAAATRSGEQALDVLARLVVDVVIVDFRLPGMNGAELCAEIRKCHPQVAVLILTSFLEDEVIHVSLCAGARGYLLKQAGGTDLARAVRAVARQESVLAPEVVERVIEWARRARTLFAEKGALATEEIRILALAAQGASNRAIAERMGIGEATVKKRLREASHKLGATGRADAVAAGIRRGVI